MRVVFYFYRKALTHQWLNAAKIGSKDKYIGWDRLDRRRPRIRLAVCSIEPGTIRCTRARKMDYPCLQVLMVTVTSTALTGVHHICKR